MDLPDNLTSNPLAGMHPAPPKETALEKSKIRVIEARQMLEDMQTTASNNLNRILGAEPPYEDDEAVPIEYSGNLGELSASIEELHQHVRLLYKTLNRLEEL